MAARELLADVPAEEPGVVAEDARRLLERAVDRLGLSARAARRALHVGRTIAALDGRRAVNGADIAEALQYRRSL